MLPGVERFIVAMLAVAAAGCGKSKSACKADVDDLMTFLRAMDHSGSLFSIDADTHLVMRPDLPKKQARIAPIILVKATETDFRGKRVDRAALAELLTEEQKKLVQ